ncbi:hypothetical protein K9L16_00475 [Candidatus Pacearchaeota archaeon]|nr:hypothetical protein [Candidatus Pacearchaeota archaeon]
MLKTKKGDTGIYNTVIFIVIILMLFVSIWYFNYKASNGSLVLEKTYAKKLVFLIDNSKPHSEILVDFKDCYELAEENGIRENLVEINNVGNEVIVKLSSQGRYIEKFVSDYNIEVVEFPEAKQIKLIILKGI